MSIYEIDWTEEFGRNKPAIPRPPCESCQERESLGACICGARLCAECVDGHLEEHGW